MRSEPLTANRYGAPGSKHPIDCSHCAAVKLVAQLKRTTPTWPKCGHPRTPENTAVTAERPGGRCLICKRAAGARYKRTDKGRAAYKRYIKGDKGAAMYALARARHEQTDKYQEKAALSNWRRHGVDATFTLADYNRLLLRQGGVCALCGKPPRDGKRLDVDHDHADPNGRVRGLLHSGCNINVGNYESGHLSRKPDLMARIAAYLNRSVVSYGDPI